MARLLASSATALAVGGGYLVARKTAQAGGPAPLQFAASQWMPEGQRDTTVNISVLSLPSGTITDLEASVDDGVSWTSLGGVTAGVYTLSGLTRETAYLCRVRAMNGTTPGTASAAKTIATVTVDPIGRTGWVPSEDLGTTGNIFVDVLNGDDANPGTSTGSPKQTLQAAINAATAGQTVKARSGVYAPVTLKGGVVVEGYGKEKPVISGDLPTGTLTQCSSADVGVLGPVLGVDGSPVWKFSVATAGLPIADPAALALKEGGKPLYVATDRADTSNLLAYQDESSFHLADSFTLNGSNQITRITDASVINATKYAPGDLIGRDILLYHSPNVVSTVSITDADVSAGWIDVSGLKVVEGNTSSPDPNDLRWCLTNVPASLQAGQYYAEVNGANFDVYLIPRSTAFLDHITYCAASSVVSWPTSSANDIELRGFHVTGATGDGFGEGALIYKGSTGINPTGAVVDNCLLTNALATGSGTAYGAWFRLMTGAKVRRITCYHSGGFGVHFNGAAIDNRGVNNALELSWFDMTGMAAYRCYSQDKMAFVANAADRTGLVAHGNKSNGYEQVDGILWWGNRFTVRSNGYLTWQEANSPIVAFNMIPISSKYLNDERAIVDQQNSTAPPVAATTGYIINNSTPPQAGNTGSQGHLAAALRNSNSDITLVIENNQLHGMTAPANIVTAPASVQANVITDLGWDGVKTTVAGDYTTGGVITGNVTETTKASVWTDVDNEDYSAAAGSPLLTTATQDKTIWHATVKTTYAHATQSLLDEDCKGNTFNWATVKVGADQAA